MTPFYDLLGGGGGDGGGTTGPDIEVDRINEAQIGRMIEATMAPRSVGAVRCYAHLIHGQSDALGADGDPAISIVPSHGNKMFTPIGVRTQNTTSAAQFAALGDHVEATQETSAYGSAEAVCRLYEQDGGLALGQSAGAFFQISAASGFGGMRVDEIDDPSDMWTALMLGLEKAIAYAGTTIDVSLLTLICDKADYRDGTPGATYKTNVEALRVAYQTAARTFTGNASLVCKILAPQGVSFAVYDDTTVGVPGQPTIALAQLELARDNPNYILSGPTYDQAWVSGIHENNVGYHEMGVRNGIYRYRELILGVASPPMYLDQVTWASGKREVYARVANVGPLGLVFDEENVAPAPAKGVTVWVNPASTRFSNPGDERAISKVELGGPDIIKITMVDPLTVAPDVRAGWYGTTALTAGKLTGPRTNIRRRFGHVIDTMHGRITRYDWLPVCRFTAS